MAKKVEQKSASRWKCSAKMSKNNQPAEYEWIMNKNG